MEAINEQGKKVFKALEGVQKTSRKLTKPATRRIIEGLVKKTR